MSEPIVIRAENLSKCYRISHLAKQATLRDAMHHGLRLLWRRFRWNTRLSREEFWALRDVSFEVRRGEVLGIIGRNGAGKSTLLKILSRITEPTTGRVTLRGRVASLLEVGTGFHPELTGRDNIFLNGAILGMRRAEIRAKFDEIVAFAEVEKFLDTPVKRYSSGMYVRLAFAVAAHLEPEILIVDEVLAVGDAQFQARCIGKMESVSRSEGRTVLFVAHNMAGILRLCSSVVRLASGRIAGIGETNEQVRAYLTGAVEWARVINLNTRARLPGLGGRVTLNSVELLSAEASALWRVPPGKPISLRITLTVHKSVASMEIGIGIFTQQGIEIISTLSSWTTALGAFAAGEHAVVVTYPVLNLAPGTYQFSLGASSDRGAECYFAEAGQFELLLDGAGRGTGQQVRGILLQEACFQRVELPAPLA